MVAVALFGCVRSGPEASTVVEAPSVAVGPTGELVQSVGIETMGGVFTPLLPKGCASPCSISQTFSTAEDDQLHIDVHLYRGECQLVADCHDLGSFRIVGFAARPRGEPKVGISFVAGADGIYVSAHEAGEPLSVSRLAL